MLFFFTHTLSLTHEHTVRESESTLYVANYAKWKMELAPWHFHPNATIGWENTWSMQHTQTHTLECGTAVGTDCCHTPLPGCREGRQQQSDAVPTTHQQGPDHRRLPKGRSDSTDLLSGRQQAEMLVLVTGFIRIVWLVCLSISLCIVLRHTSVCCFALTCSV